VGSLRERPGTGDGRPVNTALEGKDLLKKPYQNASQRHRHEFFQKTLKESGFSGWDWDRLIYPLSGHDVPGI